MIKKERMYIAENLVGIAAIAELEGQTLVRPVLKKDRAHMRIMMLVKVLDFSTRQFLDFLEENLSDILPDVVDKYNQAQEDILEPHYIRLEPENYVQGKDNSVLDELTHPYTPITLKQVNRMIEQFISSCNHNPPFLSKPVKCKHCGEYFIIPADVRVKNIESNKRDSQYCDKCYVEHDYNQNTEIYNEFIDKVVSIVGAYHVALESEDDIMRYALGLGEPKKNVVDDAVFEILTAIYDYNIPRMSAYRLHVLFSCCNNKEDGEPTALAKYLMESVEAPIEIQSLNTFGVEPGVYSNVDLITTVQVLLKYIARHTNLKTIFRVTRCTTCGKVFKIHPKDGIYPKQEECGNCRRLSNKERKFKKK